MTTGENDRPGEKLTPILLPFTGKEDYQSIEEALAKYIRGNKYNASLGEPKLRVDVEYMVTETPAQDSNCPDCQIPAPIERSRSPMGLVGKNIKMARRTYTMEVAKGIEVNLVNVYGGTCEECELTLCTPASVNFAYEIHSRVLSAAGLTFAEKVIAQRKNPGDIPPSRREGPYF